MTKSLLPVIVLLVMLLAAVPLSIGRGQQSAVELPGVDDLLRREGSREGTLGSTGKRLFARRIEELPGCMGELAFLHPQPGIRDPFALELLDEAGLPLTMSHLKTVWYPSHLEVHWRVGHAAPGSDSEPEAPAGPDDFRVVECKFITEDDVLVDVVRLLNHGTEPRVVDLVLSGAATPVPDRLRSRQIPVDLSAVANIVPTSGTPLFTDRAVEPYHWVEGEAFFYSTDSHGRDARRAASGGSCLGNGFGARRGDRALYLVICPDHEDLCLSIRYASGAALPASLRLSIDGQAAGRIDLVTTGGWGDEPRHWRRVRLFTDRLTPGLHKIALQSDGGGGAVNIDGFFVTPRTWRLPTLPSPGTFPSGTSEQLLLLPGSIDYDGVRYTIGDPGESPNTQPTLVALKGGQAGDHSFDFPQLVAIDPPPVERRLATYHLLALVAGPRGYGEQSAAVVTFRFDDNSQESVPFPDVTQRILKTVDAGHTGGGNANTDGDTESGYSSPFSGSHQVVTFDPASDDGGVLESSAPLSAAGIPAEEGTSGGYRRITWRFLVLPRVPHPCLQLSYVPPPGRFVKRILFHEAPGVDGADLDGQAVSPADRPEGVPPPAEPSDDRTPDPGGIPLLLAVTKEIPPLSGSRPVLLGQKSIRGLPVSLALTGSDCVPLRSGGSRRILRRSIHLEPGETLATSLVFAAEMRADRVIDRALEWARYSDPLRRHRAVFDEWFSANIPSFHCSDPYLERLWFYRWFLVRHCMLRPEAPPLTAPVFYRGLHSARDARVRVDVTAHILSEVRWLRDNRFATGQLRAHMRTMSPEGLFGDVSIDQSAEGSPLHWIPAAAIGVYHVHNETRYLKEILPLLARNVEATFATFDHDDDGLPACSAAELRLSRLLLPAWAIAAPAGTDPTQQDQEQLIAFETPEFAAYLYASCSAVAEGYAMLRDREKESAFRQRASRIQEAALRSLWNRDQHFFLAHDELDDRARRPGTIEGFFPFVFRLSEPRKPFVKALTRLVDGDAFWTAFPPAILQLDGNHAAVSGAISGGTDFGSVAPPWTVPTVWPPSTSLIADALATVVRRQTRSAVRLDHFEELFRRYVELHFEEGDLKKPVARECYRGDSGEGFGAPDTFHAAVNDLIIRCVVGILPQSGPILALHPLPLGLDHFRLSRLRYHQREVEIVWVEPGTDNPYTPLPEGLTVLLDGEIVLNQPRLSRISVRL